MGSCWLLGGLSWLPLASLRVPPCSLTLQMDCSVPISRWGLFFSCCQAGSVATLLHLLAALPYSSSFPDILSHFHSPLATPAFKVCIARVSKLEAMFYSHSVLALVCGRIPLCPVVQFYLCFYPNYRDELTVRWQKKMLEQALCCMSLFLMFPIPQTSA